MVVLVVSAIACANTGYCKFFFYDGRFAGRKKKGEGMSHGQEMAP